jgi:hypothetical protein
MLPFLLVLCAGVFEFGSLFYDRMLIETGVRDAARYMARCSTASCSETIARNIAVYGNPAGSGNARVAGWTPGQVSIPAPREVPNIDEGSGKPYRGGSTIKIVVVTTSYPYAGTGLLDFLGFDSIDITAAHEERKIGW